MRHTSQINHSAPARILIAVFSFITVGIIAGCTAGLDEPIDLNNLFFDYLTVSGSDGKYIVITGHTVSQSDITIPDTIYEIPVREVADSVFSGDTKVRSVTFGKNMRRIGNNAFGGCQNLQSITFNVSMSDIGEYAFSECTGLPSAVLPEQLRSVGRGAFYGCRSLSELTVPDGLSDIGGRAFSGTAWLNARSDSKNVIVGDGILIAYNGDRTELTVPKEVKGISGAFAGNTSLQKISLREGVDSIGDMSFMGCSSLVSVNIPSTVTRIGGNAFYGCTSLEMIVLGENIRSIGADAFTNCNAAIYVRKGSFAEQYCIDNGLDYFLMK